MARMNFYTYRVGIEGATFASDPATFHHDVVLEISEVRVRQQDVLVIRGSVGPNTAAYLNLADHAGYHASTGGARWQAFCTPAEQTALRDQLTALTVPFHTEPMIPGMDGTTLSLTLARHQVSWQFSWWMSPPPAYQPLIQIVAQLDAIGQRSFEATRARADLVTGPIERAKQWLLRSP